MVDSNPQSSPSPEVKEHTSWVARLISYCAHKPGITILLVLLAAVWGYRSISQAPLDAIPDLSDA